MRRKNGNAQFYQGRSGNRRRDDVVCRCRYAHAQYEGRNHGKEHGRKQHTARQVNQGRCQFQPHTGLGNDADDDTGCRAGNEYAEDAFGAFFQPLDDLDGLHARGLADKGCRNGHDDGNQSRPHGRIAGNQKVDNRDERQSQMAPFFQDGPDLGQLRAGNAFQIVAFRFEVNAKTDTCKI